jgi:uncharacterized membrane protein YkoI
MPRFAILTAALLLGVGILLPAAWAGVSRDEAASVAQRKVPGRVLAVERGLHVDNSVVWRIQVLTTAGEVRLVLIDAESGRIR